MKISQMTTDQAADVLIRIADPAANIMHDSDALAMLDDLSNSNADNAVKFFADNIPKVTVVLLKNHRSDVYEIVAALAEKTIDEVANQKITETIKDIKESWDGELIDFFGSLK